MVNNVIPDREGVKIICAGKGRDNYFLETALVHRLDAGFVRNVHIYYEYDSVDDAWAGLMCLTSKRIVRTMWDWQLPASLCHG